jgi:hypothetical protein
MLDGVTIGVEQDPYMHTSLAYDGNGEIITRGRGQSSATLGIDDFISVRSCYRL